MTAILNPLSTTTQLSTTDSIKSTSTDRIKTAQALSVTPESQMDLAAIFSLSGESSTPTDPGLGTLIYNASAAISRTSNQAIPRTGLIEEQTRDVVNAYSKKE